MESNKLKFYCLLGKTKAFCIDLPKYIFGYLLIFIFWYYFCLTLSIFFKNYELILEPLNYDLILNKKLITISYLTVISIILSTAMIFMLGRKIRTFIYIPIWIINLPIYAISYITPKQKNLWLFGCRQGTAYAENPKYLFEYVAKNCSDIHAIWITKNRNVFKELKNNNQNVCMAHSLNGYICSIKAYAIFISHNKRACSDYNDYATSPKTFIIQLWHGSPMKGIGKTRQSIQKNQLQSFIKIAEKKILNIIFPFIKNRSRCHAMLSASPIVTDALKSSYLLKNANILCSGYPKNDRWLSRSQTKKVKKSIDVIFMPTWRNNNLALFDDYQFNLKRLNHFCKKNSIVFHIKLHPYSFDELKWLIKELKYHSNINYCDTNDIYEILDVFDILITDYSSIIFDFVLSEKPIIYTPFDFDDYFHNDAGFLYDYNEICAGLIAHDWLELEKCIVSNHSKFISDRKKLKSKFNTYSDSNSCERIVHYLKYEFAKKNLESINWNL